MKVNREWEGCEMNTESVKDSKKIIQAWKDAAQSDDIETLFEEFINNECEWVMMATGRHFVESARY